MPFLFRYDRTLYDKPPILPPFGGFELGSYVLWGSILSWQNWGCNLRGFVRGVMSWHQLGLPVFIGHPQRQMRCRSTATHLHRNAYSWHDTNWLAGQTKEFDLILLLATWRLLWPVRFVVCVLNFVRETHKHSNRSHTTAVGLRAVYTCYVSKSSARPTCTSSNRIKFICDTKQNFFIVLHSRCNFYHAKNKIFIMRSWQLRFIRGN